MEVVLLEDVKALGKKGQIVKVNDGYARNFILPKKLGVEANTKNLNDLKLQKANEAKVAAEQLAEAKALAAKIDELSCDSLRSRPERAEGPLAPFPQRRSPRRRPDQLGIWILIRKKWS